MAALAALPPGLDRFEILLHSPDSVYFADQEISGIILLVLSQDTRISEILLELKGGAKSYWTKHSGTSRRHFADSEPYFLHQHNTEYTHSYGAVSERTLPKGKHEIPFSYQLPKTLPSSFEGDFGNVRYTGKAILERPWDFDIVSRTAFSVIGIEDMNEDTKAREPVRLEKSDFDIRFCCRKRGTMSVCLALPRSGFAAGESIPLAAEIHNSSTKTMRYAVARIKQHTTYSGFAAGESIPLAAEIHNSSTKTMRYAVARIKQHTTYSGFAAGESIPLAAEIHNSSTKTMRYAVARIKQHTTYRAKSFAGQEKCKEVSKIIVSKEKGPIAPNTTQRWKGDKLPIPPVPPKLLRCRIIDVSYTLEFEVDPGIVIMAPLVIGTIPLILKPVEKKEGEKVEEKDLLLPKSPDCPELRLIDEDGHRQSVEEPASITQVEVEDVDKPRKRVRLPSSVLSELYPVLAAPSFEDSLFGAVSLVEEKESVHFGLTSFTPKYACFRTIASRPNSAPSSPRSKAS